MIRAFCFCSLIFLFASNWSFSQMESDSVHSGIRFETILSWKQVVEKAKKEGKYIFVDCYATWCLPCKKMDKQVYISREVGEFFNQRFVSLKMQMDTSDMDDKITKASYLDAHNLKNRFKVDTYPTFLFFTSEGQLMNKSLGYRNFSDFIALGKDIIKPENNFYSLLQQYNSGKRDLSEMSFLTITAMDLLGDTLLSNKIANDYIERIVQEKNWLTKGNLQFMWRFTKSTIDIGFQLFYQNADTINKIMGYENYAQQFVQRFIYKEVVAPVGKLHPYSSEPNWDSLLNVIRLKYDQYYAERVITGAKADWYQTHKKLPQFSKYLVEYVEKFVSKGKGMDFTLNNYAWSVFQNSVNEDELNKALIWSTKAVAMNPCGAWIDTYANILYKLGSKDLAIKWEEIAVKIAPDDGELKISLEKMKNNEPTWVNN
jgi:thioredoxin-related protein